MGLRERLVASAAEIRTRSQRLVELNVELLTAELKRKGQQYGTGVALLVVAGVLALYALGFALTTITVALALVLPSVARAADRDGRSRLHRPDPGARRSRPSAARQDAVARARDRRGQDDGRRAEDQPAADRERPGAAAQRQDAAGRHALAGGRRPATPTPPATTSHDTAAAVGDAAHGDAAHYAARRADADAGPMPHSDDEVH